MVHCQPEQGQVGHHYRSAGDERDCGLSTELHKKRYGDVELLLDGDAPVMLDGGVWPAVANDTEVRVHKQE